METGKIKVSGYVRVSSKDQVSGESLSTQRKSITDFAKNHNYILTEIYADEGISGGSVKDRIALLKCLNDGMNGKFNMIVIHRLSRFGRNARELLNNYQTLKEAGIQLHSISEGIDFSSKYGEFMLTMLAAVAQLERDIIREQMMENRIARGKKGIPTSGQLPFARRYDKKTGEWSLDENAVKKIQQAADEFLAGGSLYDIAARAGMRYNHLLAILKTKCGDKFTVQFQGESLLTYEIPRILDDDTIQKIDERLKFNRRNNRTDAYGKYLLSGFLRCEKCGCLLSGQTQSKANQYYTHCPTGQYNNCKTFASVVLKPLERAIFETIFENIVDVPSFEKAIAESMPDEKMIKELELKIKNSEKELKRISRELDKLVESVLKGTLTAETIKKKEQNLLQAKNSFNDILQTDKNQLRLLPDVNTIKQEADTIRRQLLEKFSGKERLQEMSFDDKRALLYWLFDGKDQKGTPYGIYINKTGKGKASKIDYFLYGKIVGLRTLQGDNINYQEEDMNIKPFPITPYSRVKKPVIKIT